MALTKVPVPCLHGHHESHTVSLAPALSLEGGVAAEQALANSKGNSDELVRSWISIFVRYGAKDWDLCGESGEPIPFDMDALLGDYRLSRTVADAAADLYRESVTAPFQIEQQTRSPTGPTGPTTSRRSTRTRKPRASR
jgi:hypothetical protein